MRLCATGSSEGTAAARTASDSSAEYGGSRGRPRREAEVQESSRRRPQGCIKTSARLKVASLNMRGHTTRTASGAEQCKWNLINQVMRDKKIAILALQETHLSSQRLVDVEETFGNLIRICSSPDPENGSGARGVAFALNQRLTKQMKYEWREIIPGRAMIIHLAWSECRTLSILNVYAPNVPRENEEFWRTLKAANMGSIDIALGDWNITYNSIDRLPSGRDDQEAGNALSDLLNGLELIDGWRKENPLARSFSYQQLATGSQSRIDRIYVNRSLARDASDWDTTEPGIPTDHRLISVKVADYQAPFVGKGRWAMPTHMLNDEVVIKAMKTEASTLTERLRNLSVRSPNLNAQTIFQDFKDRLSTCIRNRMKAKIPKSRKQVERLRDNVAELLRSKPMESEALEDWERRVGPEVALLQNRIMNAELKCFKFRREDIALRHRFQSETVSKYWIRSNTTPLAS
ncbi:DNase I-like protein, partial [Trametes coccinea BRFM310]